ncbi:MAG: hypothetical protein AAGA99_21125 [Actinomycetota bacterium]
MADPDPKTDPPPGDPDPKDPPPKEPDPKDPPPATDGGDEQLGEGGKRALDAERAARKAADDRAKKAEAELDKLRQAGLSDHEKAVAEAKKTGAAEASAKYAATILAAEVKAAAASKVAPEAIDDLPRLLDLDPTELVGDDGTVDTARVKSAIDDAVKARPYLAPKSGSRQDPDQGSGRGGATPQLTKAQVEKMTPDEVATALAKGQLADYLASPS